MQKLRIVAAMAVLACGVAVVAQSPGKHPVSGRTFANVMGMGGAPWLDRPEREAEENPSKAIRALDIKPGMVIADVGAGTGYYTLRLAEQTGPKGKVFAVDIQPGMLEILKKRASEQKIGNIQTVLSEVNDPKLPAGSCDMILLVDVYHEFSSPEEMLRKMRTALKPDGKLVLLEFRKEDPKVPIRLEHKMTVAEAKLEVEAEGYKLDKVLDVLPWQHILIFAKKPS